MLGSMKACGRKESKRGAEAQHLRGRIPRRLRKPAVLPRTGATVECLKQARPTNRA
jgi:hypothetical protein